jgi:hypothetical protein
MTLDLTQILRTLGATILLGQGSTAELPADGAQ